MDILTCFLLSCTFLPVICFDSGNLSDTGTEKALYRQLLDDYEPGVRPVIDPKSSVVVYLGVKFNQLLDLNEKMKVMTTIVAVDQIWKDEYLTWDPLQYSGIETMYLPYDKVWKPDVVLYNSVEGIDRSPYMKSPISVSYDGNVTWFPLAKLHTSCDLDMRFFPFDHQACYLKLGSWSYSVNEVDIRDSNLTGIEKPDFVDNGEFEFLDFKVERIRNIYDCCPHPIVTLNIIIHFRRRPMFSLFTISIPCVLLSLMTVIAFILPPQSEAKIEVQLSVMLSLAVFMLLIGESLPPTNYDVPLIGVHMSIQMGLTALSFMCSVVVLRLVHTDHRDVPESMKKGAQRLAKWLCIGIPTHLKDKYPMNSGLYRLGNGLKGVNEQYTSLLMNIAASAERDNSDETREYENAESKSQEKTTPELQVLSANVATILQYIGDGILQEQRVAEWRVLGALVDRILLLSLLFATVSSTVYIYIVAPSHINS